MKKRILICGESSHIASGFGKYTKELLSRLYNTNKYDIAELSCYRTSQTIKTEPWKIYPVAVPKGHKLYDQYNNIPANKYGQWRFEAALCHFKPHIVIDFRDFWNFTFQEISSLRPFYHWLICPTYDSAPQQIDTIETFKNADSLCFHTEWAKNNLITQYNYSSTNIKEVLNDSIDHKVFRPLGHSKKFHKIKYGIPEDSFVIGSVMRNQKRKLLPDLIEVFSTIRKQHNNAILYLHTSYPDGMCWDLPALLIEHNVANYVYFTYVCSRCKHHFAHIFNGNQIHCSKCNLKTASIASVLNKLDDTDIAKVYNLFDIYIQYAICEGFGIPALEAAGCGLPVITIDRDAMGEVGKNINAILIPIKRIFRELETNANRFYPDNDVLYNTISNCINMPTKELNTIGKSCRQGALEHYNWDKTAAKYESVIDNIDCNNLINWDIPIRNIPKGYNITKNYLSNREVIYDIVDNFIQEPWLKNTQFIQHMVRSCDEKYRTNGIEMVPFDIKLAIKILETYANNKRNAEQLRINVNNMHEDLKEFVNY